MTDEERKEKERYEKIRETIEWIDNDILRAAKYLLFLKEENKYLNTKVIGSYQIEIAELKAQIKELQKCEDCKHCNDFGLCGMDCHNKDKWEAKK